MIPSALLIIGVLSLVWIFLGTIMPRTKLKDGVAFVPISFIIAAAVAKYIGL